VFSADTVNDRRLTFVAAQRFRDLRVDVELRSNAIEKIRAIERSNQYCWLLEPELLDDVGAHALGRGRGVGVETRAAEAGLQRRELAIFRAEVVAPLADAVRLVDRKCGDLK